MPEARLARTRQAYVGPSAYDLHVAELELSYRPWNCLTMADILTVRDLVAKTPKDLMGIKNMGRKSVAEVRETLQAMGLDLAGCSGLS